MNNEDLMAPSKEEVQSLFEISKNRYDQEIAHYETLVKEKPELAQLFSENPQPDSLIIPPLKQTEYISGYFNIHTYYQQGSYPFIQVLSYSTIIGHEPHTGRRTSFNGYVYGGYNLPILNFNNIHLSGVVRHTQTIINTPLSFQIFINPKNVILRLFRGNIYIGDLVSTYQNNIIATHPIAVSGVGTFNFI
ncbi:hypothetical protein [Xenorhabdus littoralis]|uniref:hypothetical protein n=1 Tax=Xenorhabdus littoralis TaxID=2582835 RepID=UPI0029E81DC8|nr:hypothetical protein [Xenorhabdus sp. psl]MDX7989933.1 hypothetical protein [Xenorhabdus sp. psl]